MLAILQKQNKSANQTRKIKTCHHPEPLGKHKATGNRYSSTTQENCIISQFERAIKQNTKTGVKYKNKMLSP